MARTAENTVLEPGTGGAALEEWLTGEFRRMVQRRGEAFEAMLKSEAACRAWQAERRAFLLDRIGPLPERTPLRPRVTGTLQGEGYRVEKILLETRPDFHLAGNLYLPDGAGPWPAVIVPCGHSHDGKAAGQYQLACRLLARHGLAAFCYDPIGQGERYQILDPTREHAVFEDAPHVPTPHPQVRLMCTTEHTMMGIGSVLLGGNVAQFRIWDGMRAIDYLQERPDIRGDRIGCTGNSGGGTETAYLMALDDRILAASPGCYLTTFQALIESKGPQDGEQNIFGQIAFGLDQADYCILRAPKPTLIAAGTRDATFPFHGTWELFRDAKRFYSRLGHPDRIDLAAPDAPHGFTLPLREAVTRFMCRHLLGQEVEAREVEALPDRYTDEELRNLSQPDWTAAELQCTEAGQVLLLPGERSVFQIQADTALRLRQERASRWGALGPEDRRALVRRVSGAEAMEEAPRFEILGEERRGAVTVRKLALTVEEGVRLPALWYEPARPSGAPVLYLHDSGLAAATGPEGAVDRLVLEGRVVLAAELRGIGETETGHRRRVFGAGRFGPDNLEILTAYLMGWTYPGMRTTDVEAWTKVLAAETGEAELDLVARGEAALPALQAAALRPEAYRKVTLERMIGSWESIAGAPETFDQTVNMVHGVLRHYDVGDLIGLAGPGRVEVRDPVDGMGRPLPGPGVP
jgi:dienelactone hydrolase